MKRLLPVILLISLFTVYDALAQSVSGRLVTSVYGWERQVTADSSAKHVRGYENIQLHFGTGNVSLHAYMQGSTDFNEDLDNDPGLRLFNAYLHVRDIAGIADLKVGRQAVYAGVNYGSIDGALLRLRPGDGIEITGYGGGLTPPSQRTDFFQNSDQNWQMGAQVLLYLLENTKIGLSYMNRHREFTPYESYRFDSQLGLIPSTIDYGSRANQYASLNAAYNHERLWVFGRYDYDFNFERTSRAELAATYQLMPALGLSLDFAHREPTIAYNSYFAFIEAEANQEAVLGLDYAINPDISILGRFSTVRYDEDNEYRISIGALHTYASIMYTRDMSYDGELDGFNMNVTYPFLEGMLVPHLGAVYSSYALAENLDRTSTWVAVAGTMVRPCRKISVDVQGQYLSNRIYKSDIRILARLNYLFAHTFGTGE